jgi:hypothetical protein
MQDFLLLGICLVAVTIVSGVFISIYSYDRLVVVQRTKFEDAWRRDGEPQPTYLTAGLAWKRSLRSGLASHKRSFVWSWSTPDWVRRDATATRLHRWLRVSALVSTSALLAVVGILVVWH